MQKTNKKKENLVYAATRSLWKSEKRTTRRVGALTRIVSWISQSNKAKKEMAGKPWYINEKRRAVLNAIFADTCKPAYDAWMQIWDTLWNFLSTFFIDLKDLCIDIVNILITAFYYINSFFIYIADWIADIAYWCEGRKRQLLGAFACITILGVATVIFTTSITAYEYSYYGKKLGVAKSQKLVYDTIDVIGDKLAKNAGANISINVERDIEFKKVVGFGIRTDSSDDILNTLTYMQDLQVDAFAICVNDVEKVIVEDEETARRILQQIKDISAPPKDGVEYSDVHFDENVQVQQRVVKLGEIWNSTDAVTYLSTGTIKSGTHIVGDNESYTEIMAMYGMTQQQLQAANPDIDLESLSPGIELALSEPNPVITVYSTERATYYESIDFGKSYIDNGSIYKGEEEVKTAGIPGKKEVVATVTRRNGKELTRNIVSSTKVSDPVAAVVYRGTKDVPESIGTGTFIVPVRAYTVTSHVGWRWGRMHNGIDLGATTGTKIYAADGGVVTFSGWQNGLGYVVYIDHGGLLTTVYGHCSKLLVSAGDKVYQGQNIALVGSTGNSTGPHLHFEIHYNGAYKNPEDYLKF